MISVKASCVCRLEGTLQKHKKRFTRLSIYIKSHRDGKDPGMGGKTHQDIEEPYNCKALMSFENVANFEPKLE